MSAVPPALLHAATLFASAFLLFWIQPLVARMALPRLGGVPAVWSTAIVFFQAAILAAALLFLRPRLTLATVPPTGEWSALWLFLVLAAASGAPVAALSATAPLLQGWFSASGRPGSEDPYFLYSASNAGSLEEVPFGLPSDWLVLARTPGALGDLPGSRPWSDDHAGLIAAFKRRQ